MKKALLLVLFLAPLLCGCGSLYAQRREVERLRLAETLGLDAAPGGVLVSLAASSGPGEEGAACYSAPGASVSQAMDSLRLRTPEEPLFCGHLQQILLGEELAREGIGDFLAFVCRSSDLRLDMPIFLLLDDRAQRAMTEAGSGDKGVVDALSALELSEGNAPRLSTAGAVLRDLERQGSTLLRCLRLTPVSKAGEAETLSLTPAGYGVLVGDRLQALIGPEDAPAAALLCGALRPCPLVLRDAGGRTVTLELQEGALRLEPLWDADGALCGLELSVRVSAALLEIDGFDRAADEAFQNAVTARMEAELQRQIEALLRLSRELGADFLGLGRRLEQAAPLRCRGLGRELGALLPSLQVRVSVRGELRHAGDLD